MQIRPIIALLSACVLLASCGPRISPIDFESSAAGAGGWRLASLSVEVPEDMVVSTAKNERYPPQDQLVWWGDPPGDRKAQVEALMTDAAERGATAALAGDRPVAVSLTIRQFHAMSPLARRTNLQFGVHEIAFDIKVRDADTGAVLATEDRVNADFRAFSGETAVLAEQGGLDQKTRIKDRVAKVVQAWLGG